MGHKRAFDPKAYKTSNERCPVKLFREFINHRPENMCHPESPLFLAVRHNIVHRAEKVWFLPKPLGKNSIGELLSKASEIIKGMGSSKGKISNHCARKTAITNLVDENINPLNPEYDGGALESSFALVFALFPWCSVLKLHC